MATPSTAAMVAWRALERTPDQQWVDWAVSQLLAGQDGEHVRQLAGLRAPLDYFETTRLLDRSLEELGIPVPGRRRAVEDYVAELAAGLATQAPGTAATLNELAGLCIALGYDQMVYPFYTLYHAYTQLQSQPVQHYHEGATSETIAGVIQQEAARWLRERGRPG